MEWDRVVEAAAIAPLAIVSGIWTAPYLVSEPRFSNPFGRRGSWHLYFREEVLNPDAWMHLLLNPDLVVTVYRTSEGTEIPPFPVILPMTETILPVLVLSLLAGVGLRGIAAGVRYARSSHSPRTALHTWFDHALVTALAIKAGFVAGWLVGPRVLWYPCYAKACDPMDAYLLPQWTLLVVLVTAIVVSVGLPPTLQAIRINEGETSSGGAPR